MRISSRAYAVFAQGPTPTDDEVNRIAKQFYCPVCESTPLDVCPTEACRQWRELIRSMLADGKSEEEIKQYFCDHMVRARWAIRRIDWAPICACRCHLLGTDALPGFQMWLKPISQNQNSPLRRGDAVPAGRICCKAWKKN